MKRKIYVGNLPAAFEEYELEYLFRNYGNVVYVKLFSHPGHTWLGKYGFVEMSSESEASNAIMKLNNYNVVGRRITVAHVMPR